MPFGGNCSDSCMNVPGSFYCSCPKGYLLSDDGYNCTGMCWKVFRNRISLKSYVNLYIERTEEAIRLIGCMAKRSSSGSEDGSHGRGCNKKTISSFTVFHCCSFKTMCRFKTTSSLSSYIVILSFLVLYLDV